MGCRLAIGGWPSPVMARVASALVKAVVNARRRQPGGNNMTRLARIAAGLEMCHRFSCGISTVVTGETGTSGIRMVEVDNTPVNGDMAVFAGIGRWNMASRFACGARAIVAIDTSIHNSCMIENAHIPGQLYMAGFTILN